MAHLLCLAVLCIAVPCNTTLFSVPKRLFCFGSIIPTLEIKTQKRLGTVKTRFYTAEVF